MFPGNECCGKVDVNDEHSKNVTPTSDGNRDAGLKRMVAVHQSKYPAEVAGGKNVTPTSDGGRDAVFKHIVAVHQSKYPAEAAGRWEYLPDQAPIYSPAHLQCLDKERQGNCYNETANLVHPDKARRSRAGAVAKRAIVNSPGILAAQDPFVWTSTDPVYAALSIDFHSQDNNDTNDGSTTTAARMKQLLKKKFLNSKIFLVGDSLTRQWARALHCELVHVLDMSERLVDDTIRYFPYFRGSLPSVKLRKELLNKSPPAKSTDYLVFSFGHHMGPSKISGSQQKWRSYYHHAMRDFSNFKFSAIPAQNTFFRTNTVRHFLAGMGDFDTNSSMAGGTQPNMKAVWSDYGGNRPDQPAQNLMGLDMIRRLSNYSVLDVSPMMLARADASFDGSHFCLPGPMDFWSRMLYAKMLKEPADLLAYKS